MTKRSFTDGVFIKLEVRAPLLEGFRQACLWYGEKDGDAKALKMAPVLREIMEEFVLEWLEQKKLEKK